MRPNILKLRTMALLLVCITLCSLVPITAQAADASGECGDGVFWSLDGGVLTVSGSGAMQNFGEFSPVPWAEYADSISSIIIGDGVTSIGNFAFFRMSKITSVTIASSVTVVGRYSFYGCTSLKMLDLGVGVTSIEESAFEQCSALPSVRLPGSLKKIGYQAFYRCERLAAITIPASVTEMGKMAFMYCTSLTSAVVLANISELPIWTFCECTSLESVSMSSSITSVGVQAFENCDSLNTAQYGGTGSSSEQIKTQMPTVDKFDDGKNISSGDRDTHTTGTETLENGSTVTTDKYYTETPNSQVDTTVTHTKTESGTTAEIGITAVIENADGWKDVDDKMIDAMQSRKQGSENLPAEIEVYLKGDAVLSGEDLSRFAGKAVELTVHTGQGTTWQVDGKNIKSTDLAESYDLSFKLIPLTDPTDEQADVVGTNGYKILFDANVDFKVELHVPLGKSLARQTAVFFSPEEKGYQRMQAVVIDGEGIAHFYLGGVSKDTEYLIGINIPVPDAAPDAPSDAIIPDELKHEYPSMEQVEQIEYVITGRKSSWGMNFGQVTQILAVVMIGAVVIVGVVVYIVFKMKLKRGYIPDMSYKE